VTRRISAISPNSAHYEEEMPNELHPLVKKYYYYQHPDYLQWRNLAPTQPSVATFTMVRT
jgi:hypothetical protein